MSGVGVSLGAVRNDHSDGERVIRPDVNVCILRPQGGTPAYYGSSKTLHVQRRRVTGALFRPAIKSLNNYPIVGKLHS